MDRIKKNFGFGCMRLPMKNGEVDIDETNRMVDTFLDAGFNYFDTAHGYLQGNWGTMPMAVYTFLEHYDFAGKTIHPFCTHEGSGLFGTVRDIQQAAPGAVVTQGLAVRGSSVDGAEKMIESLGAGDRKIKRRTPQTGSCETAILCRTKAGNGRVFLCGCVLNPSIRSVLPHLRLRHERRLSGSEEVRAGRVLRGTAP